MAPKLIGTLVTELVKALPRLLSLGGQLLSQLISGISRTIPKLLQAAKDIVKTVLDALKQLPEKVVEIGTNLVKGLWNGIKDAVGWIKDKIVEFGDSVLQGLKDFFGIESPSKVMADSVGKYLAEGIGVGFEDEMKNVTAQMQDALPTSFDTTATLNTASGSRTTNSFDDVVLAFKEALYGVKVDMDGDEMGHFVDKTVSMLMYA
jgi:phage-related protein